MTTDQTFSVTRHTLTTKKPFDAFISELEKHSPVVPPEVIGDLADLNLPQDQLRRGSRVSSGRAASSSS